MASSSSAGSPNPLLRIQVTEKLTKSNYALWRAQVFTAIRGARLEGYVTGKVVAPDDEIDEKQGDKITKFPIRCTRSGMPEINKF